MASPCSAQKLSFTVYADPPSAELFVNQQALGGANRILVYPYHGNPPTNLHFVLRASGYADLPIEPLFGDVENEGRCPHSGQYELKPITLPTYLRCGVVRYPLEFALVLGALGIGLYSGLRARRDRTAGRELQARSFKIENFRKYTETSEDPLVKDLIVVGNYRLVGLLGKGGMATVYRGLPEGTLEEDKEVAIKLINSDLCDNQDFVNRFRREVVITSSLNHPNIVGLLDYGEVEIQGRSRAFMVMEIVRGVTLAKRLYSKPAPDLELRMEWLDTLASAVDYANQKGVTHRDLKPENVMLTERGKLLVMDFGIAKSEDSQKLTATGDALGTPAYMSPEQIQGGALDPRTDQYAFGVIAYEVLTGSVPFHHDNPIQVIMMHLQEEPKPPSQSNSRLTPEVDRVILRMLAKEPDQRYPHLEEAMTALGEAVKTVSRD